MKLLVDQGRRTLELTKRFPFVLGQLITPHTSYADLGYPYGIDNGAFTGFDRQRFDAILKRQEEARDRCLFVACPDVVGSARRTLEIFTEFAPRLQGWPTALVAQDGLENLVIPWVGISAIFIGGTTDWKMSQAAADVIRTASILGRHVHIGRVNTPSRWRHFELLSANTCDGTGLSRFDWMLDKIARQEFDDQPLLDLLEKHKTA